MSPKQGVKPILFSGNKNYYPVLKSRVVFSAVVNGLLLKWYAPMSTRLERQSASAVEAGGGPGVGGGGAGGGGGGGGGGALSDASGGGGSGSSDVAVAVKTEGGEAEDEEEAHLCYGHRPGGLKLGTPSSVSFRASRTS